VSESNQPPLDDAEREFLQLVDNDALEPDLQAFLERRPEFLVLPHLLHHGLFEDVVISQFPLDTSLVTDFAYLTKHSSELRVVFVEIERAGKTLFKASAPYPTEHSELTAALAQVKTWAEFLQRSRAEVVRRLSPLMQGLAQILTINFRYVLVIGRDTQLDLNASMRRRWASEPTPGLCCVTWDTLLRHYRKQRDQALHHRAALQRAVEGHPDPRGNLWKAADRGDPPVEWLSRERPNVLSLTRERYTFKALHHQPQSLFGWVGPNEFEVSPADRRILVEWGYDMDSWDKGILLKGGRKVEWEPLTNIAE
jgi:hypothetical protein